MSWLDDQNWSEEALQFMRGEGVTLEVGEHLCKLMEDSGVSRRALSLAVNLPYARLKSFLAGEADLPLRKVADLYVVFKKQLKVSYEDGPIKKHEGNQLN